MKNRKNKLQLITIGSIFIISLLLINFFISPSPLNEIANIKIKNKITIKKSISNRMPASIQKAISLNNKKTIKLKANKTTYIKKYYYNKKRILGKDVDLKNLDHLKFSSEYNRNWRNIILKKLSSFENPDTTIKIEPTKSYIWVKKGIATYIEEVRITFKRYNSNHSSFEARIDAGKAKILHTWNKTLFEKRDFFGKINISDEML